MMYKWTEDEQIKSYRATRIERPSLATQFKYLNRHIGTTMSTIPRWGVRELSWV